MANPLQVRFAPRKSSLLMCDLVVGVCTYRLYTNKKERCAYSVYTISSFVNLQLLITNIAGQVVDAI